MWKIWKWSVVKFSRIKEQPDSTMQAIALYLDEVNCWTRGASKTLT